MKKHFDITNNYLVGEAEAVLKKLPSGIYDTCVTSPPYWNLRDYGTATWVGGSADCDHVKITSEQIKKQVATSTIGIYANTGHGLNTQYKHACPKCGAARIDFQLGLETTPELYVKRLVKILDQVYRVLKPEGTLWLNLGDTYASARSRFSMTPLAIQSDTENNGKFGEMLNGGKNDLKNHPELKDKDLIGIPWMVAFALRKRGWYLRQDIIWHKTNAMPESVKDRCSVAHEYLFLLSKSPKYYFDAEAITELAKGYDGRTDLLMKRSEKYGNNNTSVDGRGSKIKGGHIRWRFNENGEPIRNKRSVWEVATKPYNDAHFATFPPELIAPCIKAGSPKDGIVLDIFGGSGTTAEVSRKLERNFTLIDLNPVNKSLFEKRLYKELGLFQ